MDRPINGTIRMFLDDADTPTYEGPADEFFRNPTGRYAEAAGVDAELFAGTFQQRDACYLPIPFARRCRIVWTGEVQKNSLLRGPDPLLRVRSRSEGLSR
jgi:hypothetical protein